MASLSKIFGRPKMTYRGVAVQPPVHAALADRRLMPRWRGPQVMEDDSLAMGFVCHACGREFLPSDVRNRRLVRAGQLPAPVAAAPVAAAPVAAHAEEATSEDGESEEEPS